MLKIKKLFDLLQLIGESMNDYVHIIKDSEFDEKVRYIIYHSNGHCIEVEREIVDISEDEIIENIDGYSYYFSSDLYEGFKEISIDEVIGFIKLLK